MKKGIDISKWQGEIDFWKVAADGIEFVILREGYRNTVDPRFYEYVTGAQNAGIDIVGVYHFSYAQTVADVIAETQTCISHVEAAGLGKDIIVFYDFEYDTVDKAKAAGVILGTAECNQFSKAFCDYVQDRGYRAGIYANTDYYRHMYTLDTIRRYMLWLADYYGDPDFPCGIHQYTDHGRVNGITGYVDMDYWYTNTTEEKGEETMAVLIGSARSNERGSVNGGKAGDQTGGEVSTQNWYLHSKGWVVIRPNRPEVAEVIAKTMEDLCANNNVGYCQDHRLSGYTAAKAVGFDARKITDPVEIDCSEGVRICVSAAGIQVGDFYTGNEVEILDGTGEFTVIADSRVCGSSDLLQRGDILVTRTKGHTVVVLSNGAKVKKEEPIVEGWKRAADGKRWWYQYGDGNYPADDWAYLQEQAEKTWGWYLFDKDGYMLTGYQTDPKGRKVFLCPDAGIHEGKCMVTDDQGALQITEWDGIRYRI